MKTQRVSLSKHGFTLMELMVAMAITTIIVTVLVSITSIAIDTWNRSRSELRAARQAKAMVDTMARDFEALVTRRVGTSEWLNVRTPSTLQGGSSLQSTNAAELNFFSGATDRYDGQIGVTNKDMGGDVSALAYRLAYKDPIGSSGSSPSVYQTFVLYRQLVNPDSAFEKLLGQTDLLTAFVGAGFDDDKITADENFVCENIFQFSITFNVEVAMKGKPERRVIIPVILDAQSASKNQVTGFSIFGNGLKLASAGSSFTDGENAYSLEEVEAGQVKSLLISCSVLSDAGIEQLRNRPFAGAQAAEFMAKNSYQYAKLVQLPGM